MILVVIVTGMWTNRAIANWAAAIVAVACSIAFGISTTLIIGALCYLALIPAALTIGFRWIA